MMIRTSVCVCVPGWLVRDTGDIIALTIHAVYAVNVMKYVACVYLMIAVYISPSCSCSHSSSEYAAFYLCIVQAMTRIEERAGAVMLLSAITTTEGLSSKCLG
jgi:hypothetical protein